MSKNGDTKYTNMLLASFMLFVFPIICVFAGVFLGEFIGKSISTGLLSSRIAGGIIAFIIALVVIKRFDKCAKVDDNAKKIEWDDM